jgi:hypothetical protein
MQQSTTQASRRLHESYSLVSLSIKNSFEKHFHLHVLHSTAKLKKKLFMLTFKKCAQYTAYQLKQSHLNKFYFYFFHFLKTLCIYFLWWEQQPWFKELIVKKRIWTIIQSHSSLKCAVFNKKQNKYEEKNPKCKSSFL